jgi:hypothetical protein
MAKRPQDVEPITLHEAVWLIKSEINTARDAGKEINLDDITPESVSEVLRQYRGVEVGFAHIQKTLLDKEEH